MQERGIPRDATGTSPEQVKEADFKRAARVVALKETEHRRLMARLHPDWENQIEYWEISDLDAATADVTLNAIETNVLALIDALARA
jgi:protein-tyrosine-phosphatase